MTSLLKLKELGESIGLKGEDLHTFIKEQQAEEREARAIERQQSDKESEKKLEGMKIQLEHQKLEQQAREKQMELELQRMKLDKKGSTDEDSGSERSSSFGKIKKMPKMPYFNETKDFMDSYLNRFERFAEAQAWRKDSLAIYLSALLKGKVLDVYSRLPTHQANDYGTLKQALLKRYQLSEDGFKRKFRTTQAEVGESPTQFITRLASYLQRWIELANVQQTYEGLITVVIREQYLSVCSPELALFLKERAIRDLEEFGKLAEQYSEAHNEEVTFKKNSGEGRYMKPREVTHNVKKCYKCGSNSHLMKDCRSVTRETRAQATSPQNQRSCFICGKTGHIARNCFQRSKAAAMESDEPDANVPPQTNSPRRQTATDCTRCTVAQSFMQRVTST